MERGMCQSKRGTYQIWIGALIRGEKGAFKRKGKGHFFTKRKGHFFNKKGQFQIGKRLRVKLKRGTCQR